MLVPGKDSRLGSVEACRAACLANAACTAWLYCWHPSGCDDGAAINPYWCHMANWQHAIAETTFRSISNNFWISCGLRTRWWMF